MMSNMVHLTTAGVEEYSRLDRISESIFPPGEDYNDDVYWTLNVVNQVQDFILPDYKDVSTLLDALNTAVIEVLIGNDQCTSFLIRRDILISCINDGYIALA